VSAGNYIAFARIELSTPRATVSRSVRIACSITSVANGVATVVSVGDVVIPAPFSDPNNVPWDGFGTASLMGPVPLAADGSLTAGCNNEQGLDITLISARLVAMQVAAIYQ
jgi:hypothetical protein